MYHNHPLPILSDIQPMLGAADNICRPQPVGSQNRDFPLEDYGEQKETLNVQLPPPVTNVLATF